ncbi:MAG: hypothetical protein HRT87_08380 [Legionellales bacterium]|nr:hypothetical protein [Legionellales bacterium]
MSKKKQFKKALKDKAKIIEGIKNTVFKKEHIEIEANSRYSICLACPSLDVKGSKCLAPGTQPCCGECGCSLKFKTRSLSSDCPLGKWKAVMSEEDEMKLKEDLGYED